MTAHLISKPRTSEAYCAMVVLELYLANCSIESSLRELIRLRVSQINGCANCIDMHWKDARAAGESEQRLYGLSAWQECPFYSERERMALNLAEHLTHLTDDGARESIHNQAREQFENQELDDLIWVIAAINAWNRYSIGSRKVPGDYHPGATTI
ncbi:carboxymuconolactone decarboxylase family protein [Aureliella helgolandensis]|uniref:Carboxymuconolactone decarboxylase family protein n=1 Tax=Aureliella helgolandensis TaxID=2527968 RepID=A0A518G6L0_9BACT|nr:carboxymuconolactone decarboxylase family protein [Aureliella helgolandensis]QDV24222.1 Carboxymuconolactone decarboxylase family protein [Aureliella helgolandensis]